VGLAGIALAVAAVFAWRDRVVAVFAAFTAVLCLVMLGESTPAGAILYAVLPAGVKAGFQPEFWMPAFGLGLAVLAGLGATRYLKRPWLAWCAVAVVAADLTLVGAGRNMNAAPVAVEPGVTRTAFDGSEELLAKVRAYQQDAIRLFGTFGEAYEKLNATPSAVDELLSPLQTRDHSSYRNRSLWDKIEQIPTVREAAVEMVFDPPWRREMMSPAAQLQTGMM